MPLAERITQVYGLQITFVDCIISLSRYPSSCRLFPGFKRQQTVKPEYDDMIQNGRQSIMNCPRQIIRNVQIDIIE